VKLFGIKDLASSPSSWKAVRARTDERSRGFGGRRDDALESHVSTLLNLGKGWGINHTDAPDRRGYVAPEDPKMAVCLPERRLWGKGPFSNPHSHHLFFMRQWSDALSPTAIVAGKEARK